MFEKRYYLKKQQKQPIEILKFVKYLFLIIIFMFTINVFANVFLYPTVAKGSILVSPLAKDIIQKTISFINSQENSRQLEEIVNKNIDNKDNYAIVIQNLKTGERYFLNENKIFDTASLYKLWVMAVVFEELNERKLNDNDILSDNPNNLDIKFNIPSTSSAVVTGDFVSTTVADALTKMITISDNTSALLLTDKVGLGNISQFLTDNDFNQSQVGTSTQNPKSSAKDIASFFNKLYHDKLNDSASSDKMLNLLKQQQLNQKFPKYITDDVVIAHKTGELDNVSHDAGIFYTPKGDYVMVVMSKTDNPSLANEKMALFSEKVYEYFMGK